MQLCSLAPGAAMRATEKALPQHEAGSTLREGWPQHPRERTGSSSPRLGRVRSCPGMRFLDVALHLGLMASHSGQVVQCALSWTREGPCLSPRCKAALGDACARIASAPKGPRSFLWPLCTVRRFLGRGEQL